MNIYLDTVGCRLNQSEIETFARQFRAAGHSLVDNPEHAELVVVNTCAVTTAAASDSRQMIRWAARTGKAQIIATGCWVTIDPSQAAKLPGVSLVVNNASKDHLVPTVLGLPPEAIPTDAIDRTPIPGARQRTRAFIKVQDGCDNHCTFCITRVARGSSHSRAASDILGDIRAALHGGVQEIVLTGVNLGAWGRDLSANYDLQHLVEVILVETESPRLRLSSLEPWAITPGLLDLWQDPRLCRHLHIPLQSGCMNTLRRMARRTTPDSFSNLVQAIRDAIPRVAVTTDIMVGFPGESEAEFEESMQFVQAIGFAGGHVFTYSERPGTVAARLPGQVAYVERKARNDRMQAVLAASEKDYQRGFIGQRLQVLWESAKVDEFSGWELNGLTDNYLRVHALHREHLWNQITPVLLTEMSQNKLFGEIIA